MMERPNTVPAAIFGGNADREITKPLCRQPVKAKCLTMAGFGKGNQRIPQIFQQRPFARANIDARFGIRSPAAMAIEPRRASRRFLRKQVSVFRQNRAAFSA